MALTIFHWILIFFFGIFVLTLYGIRWGLMIFNKYLRAFPDYEGYWFNDDGSLKEKRIIKPMGGMGQDKTWRLQSDNPNKVKFRVLPSYFIGKAEEIEWDMDDLIEHKYKASGKIRIDFNLRGVDSNFGVKMRLMNKMLNEKNVDYALIQGKYKELQTRMEQKVEYLAKTGRSFVIIPPKAAPKRGQS